jgi:hypothetical protein
MSKSSGLLHLISIWEFWDQKLGPAIEAFNIFLEFEESVSLVH